MSVFLNQVERLIQGMPETTEKPVSAPGEAGSESTGGGSSYVGWALSAVSSRLSASTSSGNLKASNENVNSGAEKPRVSGEANVATVRNHREPALQPAVTSSKLAMKEPTGWGGDAAWGESWEDDPFDDSPVSPQKTAINTSSKMGASTFGSNKSAKSMSLGNKKNDWSLQAADEVIADSWGDSGDWGNDGWEVDAPDVLETQRKIDEARKNRARELEERKF